MLSRAEDIESVSLAVSGVGDYKRFFDEVGLNQGGSMGAGNMQGGSGADQKSLEDLFYMKEAELSKMVFTRQFTHAVIYAWVKLREQGMNSFPTVISAGLTRNRTSECSVDLGMHCSESERPDRQLHQCFLIDSLFGAW